MSATAETKIWQALRSRVATIAGYAANQFAWPMVPFTPPTANGKPLPYLDVAQMPNANVRRFIGSNDPQERLGILQIALMWPASEVGTGSGKAHPDVLVQRAGEIAAHFPTDFPLDFDGIRVRIERAPDVAQPMRDDAYWRVPVSIRYQAFA